MPQLNIAIFQLSFIQFVLKKSPQKAKFSTFNSFKLCGLTHSCWLTLKGQTGFGDVRKLITLTLIIL
jgi:hypothetical protein